jgi:opacity protein-like surface antigen
MNHSQLDVLRAIPLCLLAMFVLAGTATAQEQAYRYELTPYGGYRFGGSFSQVDSEFAIDLDDSGSYGLIFNARHTEITQWEVIYSHQEPSADTTGLNLNDPRLDLGIDYLQGGGTYLWDGRGMRPFLSATIGATRIEVQNDGFSDDFFFSFSMGLGVQFRPSDRLGIRLEARGFGTIVDSETDIFCQSDPNNALCAVRVEGDVMWQMEAMAGLVFRF